MKGNKRDNLNDRLKLGCVILRSTLLHTTSVTPAFERANQVHITCVPGSQIIHMQRHH